MVLKKQVKALEILVDGLLILEPYGFKVDNLNIYESSGEKDTLSTTIEVDLHNHNTEYFDFHLNLEDVKVDDKGNIIDYKITGDFIKFVEKFKNLNKTFKSLSKDEVENIKNIILGNF